MVDFDIDEWLCENEALLVSIVKQTNCTVFGMTFDELLQDFRVVCWNAAKKFDCARGYCFSTYAVKSMRNRVLELRRINMAPQQQAEKRAERLDYVSEEGIIRAEELMLSGVTSLEELAELGEIRDIIERELGQLSPRKRTMVLMVLRGYTQTNVAVRFGVKQPTVAVAMRKFKSNLRTALVNAGYGPEGVV